MERSALAAAIDANAVTVRLVDPEEKARWRGWMQQHHYLGFSPIVGESLWYVATLNQQWVALLGWGSAALHCPPREAWLGWDATLKRRRLPLIANNARFLILPGWQRPNLASRILARNLKRLSADWQRCHGHPILLAETFVDPARFRGTCYRAAGWLALGPTRGYRKQGRHYHSHGCPKTYFVRPLSSQAVSQLLAPFLPSGIAPFEENSLMIDVNQLPLEGEGGLIDLLQTLVDPRKPRGVRHPVVTIVAIAVCAALSGARSFTAIAEWAQGLSRETLRRLGSKRWQPPSEPTLRRVLQQLDAPQLDLHLSDWLVGQRPLAGKALSVDGKSLRRARDQAEAAPHLLSAILHQEGLVLGQVEVDEKTNEIPQLPQLLAPLPLQGAIVTADALHTQVETARFLVEEKKADYLLTVKDNQPTLRQDIEDLNLTAFPPSAHHHR